MCGAGLYFPIILFDDFGWEDSGVLVNKLALISKIIGFTPYEQKASIDAQACSSNLPSDLR